MTAVLSVLLPLSNKITGPIASDVGTNSSLSLFNTSFYNATYNVSSQGNQSLPFCGKVYEDSKLHDDSVVRIPFVVWLVLCMQVGLQITARYVCTYVCTYTTRMYIHYSYGLHLEIDPHV